MTSIAAAKTALINSGANEWTHPSTGEVRYYLNDALDLVDGLTFTRYYHGQIGDATLNGEKISNRYLNQINAKLFKVYATIDADGIITVHAKDAAAWITDAIARTLTAAIEVEEPTTVKAAPAPSIARQLATETDGYGRGLAGFTLEANATGWTVSDGTTSVEVEDAAEALNTYADFIETFADDQDEETAAIWNAEIAQARKDAENL